MEESIPMVEEALNSFNTTKGAITSTDTVNTAKVTLAQFLALAM